MVNAFEEMGDSDLAAEEAGRLAAAYAPGSEWYTANETNREAMESQARIGERMLRAAAETEGGPPVVAGGPPHLAMGMYGEVTVVE